MKTAVIKWLKEQSTEGGTLLLKETVTMLRIRDVTHREPASFWCMIHVPVSIIIPVLKKKALLFWLTHVYIVIMWFRWDGFSWLSLASRLYLPSYLTGLLEYILCPYRAVGDNFQPLVQYLLVRVMGSTGECHLWVRPYPSSCVLHVLFVWFGWF